jgi:CHASE2 domain
VQTRKRSVRTLMAGPAIIAAALAINASYPSLLNRIELQLFDLRLRSQHRPKPAGIVAIAAIDDPSLKKLGEWPWPRAVIAKLIAALNDYRVRAIGLDIVFSEPDAYDSEREDILARLGALNPSAAPSRLAVGPSNDATLAAALRAEGDTVVGFPFESHNLADYNQRYSHAGFVGAILPPAPMEYGMVRSAPGSHPDLPTAFAYLPDIAKIREAARGSAYFDITSDSDAVIRTQMMVIRFNGNRGRGEAPSAKRLRALSASQGHPTHSRAAGRRETGR